MSERKQTPDILADLLGGPSAVTGVDADIPALPEQPPVRRLKSAEKPIEKLPAARKRAEKQPAAENPEALHWEHRVASFQEHKGWRLRFVDGSEVADWANGVTLCGYIAQASTEGWQVAGACAGQPMFGVLDKYQIFLKRPA